MRLAILSLFLLAAALLGEMQAASAQSPIGYPWCSKSLITGAIRCRYTSWQQCHSRTGIGGICHRSPYSRSTPPDAPVTSRRGRSSQ
jgi:hypothetical protein